jgi:hypothetical protein
MWKEFSSRGNQAISDFKARINNTKQASDQYESSEYLMGQIKQSVNSDKEFQKIIYDAGQEVLSRGIGPTAGYGSAFVDKLFNPNLYTAEQYKKAGLKKAGLYENLTFDQVAKLKGYKNFQDAVQKGYDFRGATFSINTGGFGSTIMTAQEYYNKMLNKHYNEKTTANEMSYRYVNNKTLDKELSKYFLGVEDLKAFKPAYAKDWSSIAGFTEDDTDQKLNITENRSPKLVLHGNQLLLEVPFTYTRDGVKKETSVVVKPKAGMNVQNERILKDALFATQNRASEAERETNDMIQISRFNNKFPGNNLSPQTVKAVSTVKNGAPVQIYSVPFEDRSKLQVEKVHTGGTNPVLKIAVIDINTGKKTGYLPNPETGKTWYVNADDDQASYAAKAMMMRALGE